jgi:acyl carrier protein
MNLQEADLMAEFSRIFKQEVDPDLPLLESGVRLDSVRIVRFLVAVEDLTGMPLPQEDAFNLFALSINQLLARVRAAASD